MRHGGKCRPNQQRRHRACQPGTFEEIQCGGWARFHDEVLCWSGVGRIAATIQITHLCVQGWLQHLLRCDVVQRWEPGLNRLMRMLPGPGSDGCPSHSTMP